jgi:hypothetical protein
MLMSGLIAILAVLTAALLILPGHEGLEARVSLLIMPWGALALGFGLLWMTRNPEREAVVGKVFVGTALTLGAGLAAALILYAR